MASLNSLQTRAALAETKVTRVLDDKSVALRITYSGASTSAPVISIITATSLTLTTSLGATVFTFGSGFGTLTLLAAGINGGKGDSGLGAAGGGFTCRIMDALPTMITTASNLVVSSGLTSSTVNGETVYDVLVDTSTTKMVAYRISYDRNVAINTKLRGGHRVKVSGISYYENVSAAEAGAVRIYEYSAADGTTTLVWAATSVDATITAHDFSTCPYTASEGNDLLVMVTDASSLTDDAANYLQVSYIRE